MKLYECHHPGAHTSFCNYGKPVTQENGVLTDAFHCENCEKDFQEKPHATDDGYWLCDPCFQGLKSSISDQAQRAAQRWFLKARKVAENAGDLRESALSGVENAERELAAIIQSEFSYKEDKDGK